LWRKTPSPRQIGSRFPLGLCGGPSVFYSFFPFVLIAFLISFFFILSSFFDLPHHGIGMGDREVVARQVCAPGGGWMSRGDETRVTRKDGTKGRQHK
jgi:hypothetical protein